MKKYCLGLLFFILSLSVWAEKGESSRVLIHTLNYLSQDYAGAVKDGKIISPSEYHEMLEFSESAVKYFKQCSTGWNPDDSIAVGNLVHRLDSLINKHAPFEVVSSLAIETRDRVIKISGIGITPEHYPNIDQGKIVFKTECAKCHGQDGFGDGPEGKGLNPPPRNLHDNIKIKPLSPFFVFNTVRLGVEGTGMKAHPTLDDDEVWNVAFYVLSLRYQSYKNNPHLNDEQIRNIVDSLSLEKIATTSDDEFGDRSVFSDSAQTELLLAAIRFNQPKPNNNDFLNTSLKYLDGAMELYNQGKYAEASQLATLSYLEGIEPLEMQLKSNDPALMSALEQQMQRLSRMMEQQKPLYEVKDSLKAVKETINEASKIMDKKEYSFVLALMMAVSILLREGLEAFLVIMVILSIIKASGLTNAGRWVHAGWITAVLSGVVIWFISGTLLKGQNEHMELLEGVISLLAVVMLLYVGFWLHGKSEINKWKDYVSNLMKGAVKNESMLGLASLSFFVVFREVFESVLFLSALNIESSGKQSNAIILGVVIAFAIVIALAFFLLRFSTKLPVPKLFKISSFVMGVLAVVLAGKGVHSLQETNIAPIHGLHMFRVEILGIFPTIETCAAQLAVLLIVAFVWRTAVSPKK